MEKHNRNDPQQNWEQLNHAQKVVQTWEEHKKYANALCDKREDGEDISQDTAEIFLNVERIQDVFTHKNAQNALKTSILSLLENSSPPQNNYTEYTQLWRRCLRNLAVKLLRENQNKKINLFEIQKMFKNAGFDVENTTVNYEINLFFNDLIENTEYLEQPVLAFIEKKKGYSVEEIAKSQSKSCKKVERDIKIITDILEEFKIKENEY